MTIHEHLIENKATFEGHIYDSPHLPNFLKEVLKDKNIKKNVTDWI